MVGNAARILEVDLEIGWGCRVPTGFVALGVVRSALGVTSRKYRAATTARATKQSVAAVAGATEPAIIRGNPLTLIVDAGAIQAAGTARALHLGLARHAMSSLVATGAPTDGRAETTEIAQRYPLPHLAAES
jgi:hypothetical protein